MQQQIVVFWFRRDLRLEDNAGLYYALRSGLPVLPVFIYDKNILDDLDDKEDRRLCFIHDSLQNLQVALLDVHSTLYVLYDTPEKAFKTITERYNVTSVYTNEDYEPYAKDRDERIKNMLEKTGIAFKTYKDQVIFSRDEVLKNDGTPYTVYTPYSKRWKEKLNDFYLKSYPTERYFERFLQQPPHRLPSLTAIGFEPVSYEIAPPVLDEQITRNYDKTRNLPGIDGTTRLSPHLRFGTVSVRKIAQAMRTLNETALNELIWRDFFACILYHYPDTVSASFKPAYDNIRWRYNEEQFAAWCEGRTGYPIVDAGMRQLNETGWMHNRVRMITASFLCKHLLIDWRLGEAYFAKKLLDYDMSQNIGNWQWVAGSGVDAAPYFRIFNPITQQEKFDPDLAYVKTWVSEYGTANYPAPIIDHNEARARCLNAYKAALGK